MRRAAEGAARGSPARQSEASGRGFWRKRRAKTTARERKHFGEGFRGPLQDDRECAEERTNGKRAEPRQKVETRSRTGRRSSKRRVQRLASRLCPADSRSRLEPAIRFFAHWPGYPCVFRSQPLVRAVAKGRVLLPGRRLLGDDGFCHDCPLDKKFRPGKAGERFTPWPPLCRRPWPPPRLCWPRFPCARRCAPTCPGDRAGNRVWRGAPAAAQHLHRIDHRRIDGEHALHSFAVGNLADGEILVEPAAAARV